MITLLYFLLFIAFYVLINTSKRAELYQIGIVEKAILKNIKIAKIIGVLLLAIACVTHISYFGLGVGVLIFFVNLMTVASFIVVLNPFKLITYKSVVLIFLCVSFLEFFIF